ncbi:MAG: hypothetical protein ABI462_03125 [Ignavibacteria bacterium]
MQAPVFGDQTVQKIFVYNFNDFEYESMTYAGDLEISNYTIEGAAGFYQT